MLRLAADENLNNDIVRGVLRRNPEVDIVRIQDAGLSGADDPTVLEWTAQTGRVLLTHDVTTITRYAYERIRDGKPSRASSRLAAACPSVALSKTYCCWRSTAWMENGKSMCVTCRCGEKCSRRRYGFGKST